MPTQFPLQIEREGKAPLLISSLKALHAWVQAEHQCWAWLGDPSGFAPEDAALHAVAVDLQLVPLVEMASMIALPRQDELDWGEHLTQLVHRSPAPLLSSDPAKPGNGLDVLPPANSSPSWRLGYLAQQLGLPYEPCSAQAFAGRAAALTPESHQLQAITQQATESLVAIQSATSNLETEADKLKATQGPMRELERLGWRWGLPTVLSFGIIVILALAGWGAVKLHKGLLDMAAAGKHSDWYLLTVRLSATAAFGAVLFYLVQVLASLLKGAMQDRQWARRRYVLLKVALQEQESRLFAWHEGPLRETAIKALFADLTPTEVNPATQPAPLQLSGDKILDLIAKALTKGEEKGAGKS